MDHKSMWHINVESAKTLFRNFMLDLVQSIRFISGALPDNVQVTSLVNDHSADLALVPLLAEPPDEVLAMGTEGRLSEEQGHELVTRNLVDLSTHSSSSLTVSEGSRPFLEYALCFTRILWSLFRD